MRIRLEDADEDYGTLVVELERDDSINLSGHGNAMTLRLPLYAHEAADIIEMLTPIAYAKKPTKPKRNKTK